VHFPRSVLRSLLPPVRWAADNPMSNPMAIIRFCILLILGSATSLAVALPDSPSRVEQLPDPVVLKSPQNGTSFLYPDSITFVWHKGTPNITRYWLEIAIDSNFFFSVVDSSITDTVKTLSQVIAPPNRYYWRVRANNAQGWGAYSEVWQIRTIIVSVQSQLNPPECFLQQNYPNPFNYSTVIRYSVSDKTFVSLRVYSALGQLVAILANGEQQPGQHSVTFDATNLPSGVYFFRFMAQGAVQTRRIVFLK
jgi:hypothetical protein